MQKIDVVEKANRVWKLIAEEFKNDPDRKTDPLPHVNAVIVIGIGQEDIMQSVVVGRASKSELISALLEMLVLAKRDEIETVE